VYTFQNEVLSYAWSENFHIP